MEQNNSKRNETVQNAESYREEDFSLIRAVVSSEDEEAFSILIQKHRDKIKKSIFSFGAKEEECEEIVQGVFIKLWKNLKHFKFQSSFYTWYYRIAYNVFVDERRRASRSRLVNISQLVSMANERTKQESVDTLFDLLKNRSTHDYTDNILNPYEIIENTEKDQEAKSIVKYVLNRLSSKHKEVLELFEFDDLSYVEIAKKTNSSIGTVMSRLFYARKHAKRILKGKVKK